VSVTVANLGNQVSSGHQRRSDNVQRSEIYLFPIFSDFFRCHNILQATDLIVTVTGYGLGNATDPSVTVTVA
jgi:hypothetical protein